MDKERSDEMFGKHLVKIWTGINLIVRDSPDGADRLEEYLLWMADLVRKWRLTGEFKFDDKREEYYYKMFDGIKTVFDHKSEFIMRGQNDGIN